MDGFVLITGVSAAGKSTVAGLLAARLPRAAHVRGDAFRRAIVSGRAKMSAEADDEALRQLRFRYRLGAMVGDAYIDAGFTAVVQDVVIGRELSSYATYVRSRPLRVVVLDPSLEAVVEREAGREKHAYGEGMWDAMGLHAMHRRETPRIGLWLDTSGQSPAETVGTILARAAEAVVLP